MTEVAPQPRWLQRIETLGNRLPHPTLLFVWLCLIVPVLSWLLALVDFSARHPVTHEQIATINLLSQAGLHRILQNTVTNFTQFAPVGTVLVAMLGLGVAEKSGLLGALLKRLVGQHRGVVLTLIVVWCIRWLCRQYAGEPAGCGAGRHHHRSRASGG
jgi:aminobenzoyl-glutamate transport protein